MADHALFIPEGDALRPTEWAVGPWSPDTLQASAYGGLLVRLLERAPMAADMTIARLGFDLWRPVTREPIEGAVTVLRQGRKAQTLEASLLQGVLGEENSPLVHAVSAADLASGISAVVDLRVWTFVNADLTMVIWRIPRAPWILMTSETHAGDRGTGVAHGLLSDLDGPFARCAQTLIFERRS